jgi:hypothetical protein
MGAAGMLSSLGVTRPARGSSWAAMVVDMNKAGNQGQSLKNGFMVKDVGLKKSRLKTILRNPLSQYRLLVKKVYLKYLKSGRKYLNLPESSIKYLISGSSPDRRHM